MPRKKEYTPTSGDPQVGDMYQYGEARNLRFRVAHKYYLEPLTPNAENFPKATYELLIEKPNKFRKLK